jgi:4-amino-4-deoxy-L-arabinose transferase-like glycosyltransferase
MLEPRGDPRANVRRWLTPACVGALVAYFLLVGFVGLDFGLHPDESYHVRAVKHCIDTLTWLPQAYNYNGVYTLVGLPFVLWKAAPLLPHALFAITSHDASQLRPSADNPLILDAQRTLGAYVDSPAYLLNVRGLSLIVSSLAIPWAYLAARTLLPGSRVVAFAAAAFVGLSWEFGYHARFVAVDAMLTQFVALELWLFARAWTAPDGARARPWAWGATAAAACAFSCKSTAVFAVLPLVALVVRSRSRPGWRLRTSVELVGVFLIVTYVLSPGIFLDPIRFLGAMARERENFGEDINGIYPYYTRSWADHASRAAVWLLLVVPSPYFAVAALFFVLIALGFADGLREDPAIRAWTLYAFVFFVFISQYHLLLVRHHLVALPWLGILFAAGVRRCLRLPQAWLHRALAGALVAAFALNAFWGARAAARIRTATPASVLADFRSDVSHATKPFWLSPELASQLGLDFAQRANCAAATAATSADARSAVYFFYDHELFAKGHVNNALHGLVALYGPLAVNYDWNVTFAGKMERQGIVGVTTSQARAMELKMDGYLECSEGQ